MSLLSVREASLFVKEEDACQTGDLATAPKNTVESGES